MIRHALPALCLLLGLIGSAQAKTCNVTGAWVSFGAYNPASSSSLRTTGSVVVHCDGSFHAVLSLSVGNGPGASYSSGRKMARLGGGGTLTYNLYADSARSHVLGDGTGGSVTQNIGGITDFTQPIWARVPARQTAVLAGDYLDTVVVTISY